MIRFFLCDAPFLRSRTDVVVTVATLHPANFIYALRTPDHFKLNGLDQIIADNMFSFLNHTIHMNGVLFVSPIPRVIGPLRPYRCHVRWRMVIHPIYNLLFFCPFWSSIFPYGIPFKKMCFVSL